MNNIKISVIIPVYNVEKYLKKCLDSLLNQSFQDIEIICVDDSSPDNCPQILDDYASKDKRIIVIHKENAGQGVARNAAMKKAKGKYIFFLDSDDWLQENALAKMYDKMEKDNLDILFFNVYKHFEDTGEKVFYNFIKPYYTKFKDKTFSAKDAKDILFSTNALPFRIYRHESMKKYNFRFTEHRHWEDYLPYLAFLPRCEKIGLIEEPLLNYLIRKNSSTRTSERCFQDCFNSFYECVKEITNDKKIKEFTPLCIQYYIKKFFYYFRNHISITTKPLFFNEMKKTFWFAEKQYPQYFKEIKDLPINYQYVKFLPYKLYKIFLKLRSIRTIIETNL